MAKNHVNYGSGESQASHLIVSNFPCYNFDTDKLCLCNKHIYVGINIIEMAIGDDRAQEKLLHILTRNVNKLNVFFQTTDFCGNYGIVKLNLDVVDQQTNDL